MLVWPLLLSLALGATPTAITSSTFHFERETTLTGSVGSGQADGLIIEVTTDDVVSLSFTLGVEDGHDADLYVNAPLNGTEEIASWYALAWGNDTLEINATDYQFIDGLGLQRAFLVLIKGISMDPSEYTLTIKAHRASEWECTCGESMKAFVATRKSDKMFTVKKYKGDVTPYLKAMETSNSWMGVVGGMVLLGAGVCAWRKWGGRQGKTEELAYRLI